MSYVPVQLSHLSKLKFWDFVVNYVLGEINRIIASRQDKSKPAEKKSEDKERKGYQVVSEPTSEEIKNLSPALNELLCLAMGRIDVFVHHYLAVIIFEVSKQFRRLRDCT